MASIHRHFDRHFLRTPQKQRVLDQIPRHRSLIGKGGQLFALVCFRETHKGFQSFHSTENKRNNSAISSIHFQYTFNTLSIHFCLFFFLLQNKGYLINLSVKFKASFLLEKFFIGKINFSLFFKLNNPYIL